MELNEIKVQRLLGYSNGQLDIPEELPVDNEIGLNEQSMRSSKVHVNPAFADSTEEIQNDVETPVEQTVNDIQDTSNAQTAPVEVMQEEFEDLEEDNYNKCVETLARVQDKIYGSLKRNEKAIQYTFYIVLLILYLAYFIWCMYCGKLKSEGDIRLLWVTLTFMVFYGIYLLRKKTKIDDFFKNLFRPLGTLMQNHRTATALVFFIVSCIVVVVIIIVEVIIKHPGNLISLAGMFVLILLCYLTSTVPKWVRWRPVLSGLFLQFVLAYLILRTKPGLEIFKFLGDRVDEFLKHTDAGSRFVFGASFGNFFAFSILTVIIFFSSIVALLFYLGWIQVLIVKMGFLMQFTMGTTYAESLNAAANIFIGQTEAPLLIRPYLGRMTNSEIHAVMTGGFATIAGSVLATYISFGVPPVNLLTASVMSAPAALAVSKLMYPETKKSRTSSDELKIEAAPYRNAMEAVSSGASDSIVLVANIGANLIAFLAILHFANSTLTWIGYRACLDFDLTFEFICSYVLSWISFLMGCPFADCRKVAELIGIKVFLNEFIAYQRLGLIKENRLMFERLNGTLSNVTWTKNGDAQFFNGTGVQTLVGGFVSERSEFISQYALCGFANLGSMGIMLGGLSAMAPKKRRDMSQIVFRAMIAGNVACFLTACIAGLFYDGTTLT